jgi:hypothetical protein
LYQGARCIAVIIVDHDDLQVNIPQAHCRQTVQGSSDRRPAKGANGNGDRYA